MTDEGPLTVEIVNMEERTENRTFMISLLPADKLSSVPDNQMRAADSTPVNQNVPVSAASQLSMPVGQAILVSQDFRLGGRIPKAILPKPAASDKVADEVIQCTLQNARKVNDLQTEIKINSRCFNAKTIQTYARLQTLECRIPSVRCPTGEEIVCNSTSISPSLCDVFAQTHMPGFSSLLSWTRQLEENRKRAPGDLSYVSTEQGSYSLTDVNHMLALHKAAATRRNVERELEWFAHMHLEPRTIKMLPGIDMIRRFQMLVLCPRWNAVLNDYKMTSGELAKICCDRWLTSSHMAWTVEQLNAIQVDTLCISSNDFTTTIVGSSLIPEGREMPKSLLIICHVGKLNYSQSEVFISTEKQRGNHYSICHLDTITKKITYADTLGWKVPELLPKYLVAYHTAIYGPQDMTDYKWHVCHQPGNSVHCCSLLCSAQFPLQTCLTICGPVVIIMAALGCLRRDVFFYLTSANQQSSPELSYLETPTKYAQYLRKVVAVWLAKKFFNLEYIVPHDFANPLQNENDIPEVGILVVSLPTKEEEIVLEEPSTQEEEIGSEEPVKVLDCLGEKVFRCPCCYITCKKSFNMKRHILRAHPNQDLKSIEDGNCLCVHCGLKCRRICDLRQHLQNVHASIFTMEEISFESSSEFETWKKALEEAECCSFAQYSGVRNKGDSKFRYLQCNRSGVYKKTGGGKRQMKHSGSCKIDNNCTATMKVTFQPNGKVDVECHRNHYNHHRDRELIWLPRKKREEVIAKVERGISRDSIMDDMRDSKGERRRQELMRQKDIKKSLDVMTYLKQRNEKDSVLAWIQQWEKTEENPILFFKMPGTNLDSDMGLFSEDYIIVVQSPFQKHMAQKLASQGMWCESTEGTTLYDYHLTTLFAFDEFLDDFPLAWCISNRDDASTVRIFFTELKKTCSNLKPCWFMADKAFLYANIWTSVFGTNPERMICPWNVDYAWREALKNEIADLALQAQVYKMLREVLEQQDQTSFEDSLQRLLSRLAVSTKTLTFLMYFIREWIPKMYQWPFCYRTWNSLTPGVFHEAFHVVFQQVYVQGDVNKRVDSCLIHLLKYIRDKTFHWMVKFPRVKVTMRLKVIRDHHLQSMMMSFVQVKQLEDCECWEVHTEDKNTSYVVERLAISCPTKECRLHCEECNVCVHTFFCNCPDCLINSTICKHIHLVQRFIDFQVFIQSSEVVDNSGMEAKELKRNLRHTLRQLTSVVEASNDENIETLRELSKTISSAKQCLNPSILQRVLQSSPTHRNVLPQLPANIVPQDSNSQNTPSYHMSDLTNQYHVNHETAGGQNKRSANFEHQGPNKSIRLAHQPQPDMP
ncbi:uncharacterized protein LOC117295121 [Asterias rubens]|uniref:uncharacterized protein LOC117295121 n=1 Tax=Asterias rubens TaxID=7604 RepID=UPI001454E46B|nr:uncharacterized protein LOC117295121 [Asterias rubens]